MTKTIISKNTIYLYFAIKDKTLTVYHKFYFNNFNFCLSIEYFEFKIADYTISNCLVKTYQNDKNNY